MDRNQMIMRLEHAVNLYLESDGSLGPDVQAAIDRKDFSVNVQTVADRDSDIDNSDATVEESAVAEGLADQDGMDYQSARNWDLYPMTTLIKRDGDRLIPDLDRIAAIVDSYIAQPANSRTPYTF